MTDRSMQRGEQGLSEFLARRARGASDRRLVMDAVGGILVVVAMVIWRPTGGLLVLFAALCFAAFGCWGILDRELQEGIRGDHRVLGALKVLAAVVGTLAAAGLVLGVTAVVLGRVSH